MSEVRINRYASSVLIKPKMMMHHFYRAVCGGSSSDIARDFNNFIDPDSISSIPNALAPLFCDNITFTLPPSPRFSHKQYCPLVIDSN